MVRRGHNEGSISLRPDGRWVARVSLEGGKRKQLYAKTKAEAKEKLREGLRARDEGRLFAEPGQKVNQYLRSWLEDQVQHSVRPRTYESYALNVRRVEQAHTVLRIAFRQAVCWGYISQAPTSAAVPPRPKRKEMRSLSPEEVGRLFEATADDPLHALWIVLVTTGLRIGEASGLTWKNVDLNAGTAAVRQAVQRQQGKGLVVVEPKTERSRRTVHLAAGAIAALREHRKRQNEQRLRLGAEWHDLDLVFCTPWGGLLDPGHVRLSLHRGLGAAGLPLIRVHDLRHTAASYLLSLGTHPKVVQELLGHSSVTLTLDTYSHVLPALHKEVAHQMDALFDRKKGVS